MTITGGRTLIILALLPVLLTACRKTDDLLSVAEPVAAVANVTGVTDNLLVNGSLASLDFWPVAATSGGIIHSSKFGVELSGNRQGKFIISQRVTLPAKKFYKVSVTADYTLNDFSPVGIYVMDSTMTQTIGEYEKVLSSGSGDTWDFVFYCKKPGPVVLVMGSLNGINGTVRLANASLTEYTYQARIKSDGFSTHLAQKFPLLFTPGQYDSTINRISDYLNSVLLCRYAYFNDTTELPVLDKLIGTDTAYAYFNSYRHALDSITDSYCQKSSLSLGEILTNEFNIPVRQTYMSIGGVGLHQFLEYWNPFAAKWLIIDPCFSARYQKNGKLLGDEDIDKTTAPGYMTRFGQYYYYQTTDELDTLWQQLDILDVKDYYVITFPFS
ncbi:MAG TPA: hypothetical protein VNW04_02765 [Puia sp.]|nr:hypothetical protein [Puia sp.]